MTRQPAPRWIALAVLTLLFTTAACESSRPPSGPTRLPPTPAEPAPPPAPGRYHVSGVVTDDNGSAIANAEVALVDHPRNDRQATTSTNGGGYYEIVLETETTGILLIHAGGGEYEHYFTQALPSATPDIVKNLRLRRKRTLEAGQSIVVSIDPYSSLAYDGEDWMALDRVWERLHIRVANAGTLTVDARPELSGIVPSLAVFCIYVIDNCRFDWVKPPAGSGTGSLIVKANSLFEIRLAIPSRMAPQRYEVATSLER